MTLLFGINKPARAGSAVQIALQPDKPNCIMHSLARARLHLMNPAAEPLTPHLAFSTSRDVTADTTLCISHQHASEPGLPGLVRLWSGWHVLRLTVLRKADGENLPIKNERNTMDLTLTPVLASAIWIGGGSVGLLLLIVVVVLLLR
jgi:hypothetical protein